MEDDAYSVIGFSDVCSICEKLIYMRRVLCLPSNRIAFGDGTLNKDIRRRYGSQSSTDLQRRRRSGFDPPSRIAQYLLAARDFDDSDYLRRMAGSAIQFQLLRWKPPHWLRAVPGDCFRFFLRDRKNQEFGSGRSRAARLYLLYGPDAIAPDRPCARFFQRRISDHDGVRRHRRSVCGHGQRGDGVQARLFRAWKMAVCRRGRTPDRSSGQYFPATAGVVSCCLGDGYMRQVSMRDFSGLVKWLFAGVVVLLIAAAANIFLQLPALYLAVSVIAIAIFSAYILFDVQQIINGGETNYISATLALYLDVYNIFANLLSLLGIFGGSRD